MVKIHPICSAKHERESIFAGFATEQSLPSLCSNRQHANYLRCQTKANEGLCCKSPSTSRLSARLHGFQTVRCVGAVARSQDCTELVGHLLKLSCAFLDISFSAGACTNKVYSSQFSSAAVWCAGNNIACTCTLAHSEHMSSSVESSLMCATCSNTRAAAVYKRHIDDPFLFVPVQFLKTQIMR